MVWILIERSNKEDSKRGREIRNSEETKNKGADVRVKMWAKL